MRARPLRIGIFTCNYTPLRNGVVTSITTYKRHLETQGHQVFVFAPRYSSFGHSQREANVYRFTSLRAPTHQHYSLPIPFAPRIRAIVEGLNLDVFHAQHPFLLGPYALRLARRHHRPLVFTYHTRYDRYGHYSPLFPSVAGRLALWQSVRFANQADAVIALTRAGAQMLAANGVTARIELVPTGVAPGVPTVTPAAVRQRLATVPERPILLFTGRLAKEKNLGLLLDAHARVLQSRFDAALVLVGDGDQRSALLRKAQELGTSPHVHFVGEVPNTEVWSYYNAADLFVMSSTSEMQPLAPLEAITAGLPVIAARYPGIEDYIDNGRNGYIVDPDANALATAIVDVLRCPEARRSLAAGAIRTAQHFAPERSVERMLGLYYDVMESASGASYGR